MRCSFAFGALAEELTQRHDRVSSLLQSGNDAIQRFCLVRAVDVHQDDRPGLEARAVEDAVLDVLRRVRAIPVAWVDAPEDGAVAEPRRQCPHLIVIGAKGWAEVRACRSVGYRRDGLIRANEFCADERTIPWRRDEIWMVKRVVADVVASIANLAHNRGVRLGECTRQEPRRSDVVRLQNPEICGRIACTATI